MANYIHTYLVITTHQSRLLTQFLTTYVACVNCKYKWRDIQFKVDAFHGNFIFTVRVFARNLLRGNRRKNTFCFDVWPGARYLAIHLISQHITYQTTANALTALQYSPIMWNNFVIFASNRLIQTCLVGRLLRSHWFYVCTLQRTRFADVNIFHGFQDYRMYGLVRQVQIR